MRRAAALRFWLLRLEAAHRPRQGDVVSFTDDDTITLTEQMIKQRFRQHISRWYHQRPGWLPER